MIYSIVIHPDAIQDIQEAIDYYDEQEPGLGRRFEEAVHKHFRLLEKNPVFQIRYDNVRCLPMKKFPYMVHFTIDEKFRVIKVWALFHTSVSPGKWRKRF